MKKIQELSFGMDQHQTFEIEIDSSLAHISSLSLVQIDSICFCIILLTNKPTNSHGWNMKSSVEIMMLCQQTTHTSGVPFNISTLPVYFFSKNSHFILSLVSAGETGCDYIYRCSCRIRVIRVTPLFIIFFFTYWLNHQSLNTVACSPDHIFKCTHLQFPEPRPSFF